METQQKQNQKKNPKKPLLKKHSLEKINNPQIESDESELLEKLGSIKEDLSTSAHSMVHIEFPKKVIYLNNLLKEPPIPLSEIGEESLSSISHLHSLPQVEFLLSPSPLVSISGPSSLNTPHNTQENSKKRKLEDSHNTQHNKKTSPSPTPPSNNTQSESGNIADKVGNTTHKTIAQLVGDVKKEALEMIFMVSRVKLWVQLNIPRIEDGNNFGVGIQEETVSELGKVEEAGVNILESLPSYFLSRAKLLSRIHKYPFLSDYIYSVKELDEKQYVALRIYITEIRNGYAILHDMILKNLEKITKPRASNHMESLF